MPPKTVAISIGINYYGTSAQLKGCHTDVDSMCAHLARLGVKEFVVLKDSLTDSQHRKEDAPTRSNIICAIKDTYARLEDGDTVIFHYSGHGSQLRDLNKDEKDGKDECICPVDFVENGVLIDDDLKKLLVDPLTTNPALAHCKLRCFFDSCHSGSVLDLPVTVLSRSQISLESGLHSKADIVCFSGCKDAQTSADAIIAGKGQGAMTAALLSALCELKAGSTWLEVQSTTQAFLKRWSFSQSPCLSLTHASLAKSACDLLCPPVKKELPSLSVEDCVQLLRSSGAHPSVAKELSRAVEAAAPQSRAVPKTRGAPSGNSGRQ